MFNGLTRMMKNNIAKEATWADPMLRATVIIPADYFNMYHEQVQPLYVSYVVCCRVFRMIYFYILLFIQYIKLFVCIHIVNSVKINNFCLSLYLDD